MNKKRSSKLKDHTKVCFEDLFLFAVISAFFYTKIGGCHSSPLYKIFRSEEGKQEGEKSPATASD